MSRALAAVLVLSLLAGGHAAAEVEPTEPYKMARSLQMLQDEVARGNAAAHGVQQRLVEHMTVRFLAASREVWRSPRNMRAAIVHGLSGGNPKVLRTLISQGDVPEAYLDIAKGALAYMEGRGRDAAKLLGALDARVLDPSIAGHVALVQSTLAGDEQPKKAIPYLNLARLLMPGTLVEEAALRRQCMVVAGDGDLEAFERLARQYLDRFGNSLYAMSFRQQFASTVVRLDYASGPGRLGQLRAAIDRLELADQRELYLMIARLAVSEGALGVAGFASAEAARVSEPGTIEALRASLYGATVGIVGDDYERAYMRLKGIDRSRLDAADSQILASALSLAGEIRKLPEEHAIDENGPDENSSPRSWPIESDTARKAEALIGEVAPLLPEGNP